MDVKVRNFNYDTGDKWSCGALEFDADTPLGVLAWRQVVPGPWHGDSSAKLTVTLNGNKLSEYKPGTCTCYPGFGFPDFEPPRKDGRDAHRFAENGEELVAEALSAWLAEYAEHEELQRVRALPAKAEG